MAMTYSILTGDKTTSGSIKDWINWSKAPSDIILSEAEAFIYSQLRIREMKALAINTIAEGVTFLNLPDDFIASISFRRYGETAGKLKIFPEMDFEQIISIDSNGDYIAGTPSACMIIGDSPPVAYLNCETDDDIPYRLVYYARPEALSTGNETNWLTTRYPVLLRSACLGFANLHQKNAEESDRYLQLASGLINSANGENDMAMATTEIENDWEKE